MNNIFSKLRDFVGLNEQVEYEYYEEEPETESYQNLYQEENPQPAPQEPAAPNRRWREPMPTMGNDVATGSKSMGNVIGMPGAINGISEVLVLEPRTFEEMPQAIQALRERKSVVLNLTIMDPDQAQRAVDFVAGGTYALDGHQERIGESIFLFTLAVCKLALMAELFTKYHNHPHVLGQQLLLQHGAMKLTGWQHNKGKVVKGQGQK